MSTQEGTSSGTMTTGISQHAKQLRQIVNESETKDFRTIAQSVQQAVNSGQLPQQYQGIAQIVSQQYDRLPEGEKSNIKHVPAQVWSALFELCDTLVLAKNHLGLEPSQMLGQFYSQVIQETSRQQMPSGFINR